MIDQEKGGFQLASWDWAYYSEKVRQARYAFDEAEIKPYFELNHVLLDGVFYAATQLYGITFKERHDLPVYQPDVRVFDVFDKDGKPLAIFLADYYARPSKRGGAWMNEYVNQSQLLGMKPVVANHLNIPKPEAGQPTLLTYDEVRTDVSRVRPCASRDVFQREIPALQRDERAARFRRVSVAGERDVGDLAGSAAALRETLPDRRADAEGAARQGPRGGKIQPGLQDDRISRRHAARPGLAPADAGRSA